MEKLAETHYEILGDEFGLALKKRLETRRAKLATETAAVVVRKYFDLLTEHRNDGVPWDVIAEELSALGCVVTPKALSTTYARAKQSIAKCRGTHNVVPLAAPAARDGGEQGKARPLPPPVPVPVPASVPVQAPVVSLPAPVAEAAPVVPAQTAPVRADPVQVAPAPPKRIPEPHERPPAPDYEAMIKEGKITENWVIERVERIRKAVLPLDREFPELRVIREIKTPDGRILDVKEHSNEYPAEANRYMTTRLSLFRQWGLVGIFPGRNAPIVPWGEIPPSKRQPILIDMDALIGAHGM